MFMILIGIFQGTLLFVGLSLALNVVVFTSTNWGFIFLMALIGAVIGGLVGVLLRNAEPANVWALPLGSIIVTLVVGIFAMAFDFFIFGIEQMHWRGIAAFSLISSAPGLIVGWILAHQFSGDDGRTMQSSGNRSVCQPVLSVPREPLPEVQALSNSRDARYQQLERMLQTEIKQFPAGVQASAPQRVGENGNLCVTATLNGRGQVLKFYLVCTPDYPNEAPQLLIEQLDRLQDNTGQEVHYRSQVIQQWGMGSRLYQVVDEVYRAFTGY